MSNPFDFFDQIYCINLPDATDRWELAQEEFEKVGIEDRVTQVSAIQPHGKCKMPALSYPIGELGAWLSHGKALVQAIESDADNVLILEDDVMFRSWTMDVLTNAISELPTDYDMFFLTGTPAPPLQQTTKHLAKLDAHFYGAVAYCVPRKSMLKLYELRLELIQKRTPVADSATSHFAIDFNSYAAIPYVCLTRPGHSIIRNGQRYHDKSVHKVWKRAIPSVFESGEYDHDD